MTEIYTVPPILTVQYHEEENFILLKWYAFNIGFEEIRNMHKHILDFAIEKGCYAFIVDTSETTSILGDTILAWWKNTWIKKLREHGIQIIVTILPREITAQISTFEWQQGDYGCIKLINVLSMDLARAKVKENYRIGAGDLRGESGAGK